MAAAVDSDSEVRREARPKYCICPSELELTIGEGASGESGIKRTL